MISEIFAVMPGVSKITALAPERLRPSRVKVAVLPRSMPTGQILERLGGMIGSSAHSGKANNETHSRILIFTWHLVQVVRLFTGSRPAFFPLRQQAGAAQRPSIPLPVLCHSSRRTGSACR